MDKDTHFSSRKRIRASWHNYAEGTYFITICVNNQLPSFGTINSGVLTLSKLGEYAQLAISELPLHHQYIHIDNYVIMPNHIHLLLTISSKNEEPNHDRINSIESIDSHGDAKRFFSAVSQSNSLLSIVIQGFKASVTRFARQEGIDFKWQSRFYDEIIRNNAHYEHVWNYIDQNVQKWFDDEYHI